MGEPSWFVICRVVHRPEEDIFQRVAALVHTSNLNALFRGDDVEVTHGDIVRDNKLDAPAREAGTLAAQSANADGELLGSTHGFKFHEAAVGASLRLDVAERGDAPLL